MEKEYYEVEVLPDRKTDYKKYSTFLLYLLIHNFISQLHHIYKPILNIDYPIIRVYRSDQFECNSITDLTLNIHPLYLYNRCHCIVRVLIDQPTCCP